MIGITLAMSGMLNSMVAAGAMVLSGIFVITNSLRLDRDGIASENVGDSSKVSAIHRQDLFSA